MLAMCFGGIVGALIISAMVYSKSDTPTSPQQGSPPLRRTAQALYQAGLHLGR
jgi:hypothetical protein